MTTRRHVLHALSALSLTRLGAGSSSAAAENLAAAPASAQGKSQNSLATDLTHCTAFPFATLPVRLSDAGAPTRDVLRGTLPTGELVELHETTVEPGKMPHPAHQHPHEEFILVREGTIDFLYAGQSHILEAGGVGYTAPNEMHGFRNSGTIPASYFIFSVGKK